MRFEKLLNVTLAFGQKKAIISLWDAIIGEVFIKNNHKIFQFFQIFLLIVVLFYGGLLIINEEVDLFFTIFDNFR